MSSGSYSGLAIQDPVLICRLLPLTGAPALVTDRLTGLVNVRDVVRELLTTGIQKSRDLKVR